MEARSQPPELVLGKYHIVKPLKIGGTAAIYLAIMRGENNFSREVVIKRPLPHLIADRRSRLMFIDEAHIAARLSHPNICQVLDLVAREHEVYLVLEYLRGVDVREMLKRCIQLGRLMPPEVAVWVAIEMAAGLHCAHEALGVDGNPLNLVHRDVSPKNIRVTFTGSVKVIDFGIARAMNRATETAAGTIKGTLGYMSPEQILGDDIDRRSDIFAFGICLFQMLTCRNPFDGPTLKERVRRLTQAPIPSVREFNPALDDEIAGIVARCLDRDIDERYANMREVQIALDRYLAHLQVVSPRQRLIEFLEDIFPGFDEEDTALKSALSEISSVPGKIDTAQRLRFPDDPPTETDRRPSSASAASVAAAGTAATEGPPGPSEVVTQAQDTEADNYFTNDTRHLTENQPVVDPDGPEQTGATVLAPDPKPPASKPPWLAMGIGGFVLALLVAVFVSWWTPREAVVERIEPPTSANGTAANGMTNPTGANGTGNNGTGGNEAVANGTGANATGNGVGANGTGANVGANGTGNGVGASGTGANATGNGVGANGTGANTTSANVGANVGANGTGANVRENGTGASENGAVVRGAAANGTTTQGTATNGAATNGNGAVATVAGARTPRRNVTKRTPGRRTNRQRAQLLFRTARRFEKKGDLDEARLLYQLAHDASGRRVDPAVYLNLGLMYNRDHDVPKAKACLSGFLDRSPDHPVAPRVRTLLSSFPAVKTVECVDRGDARDARRQYERRGAEIDGWVQDTLERSLR